MIVNLAFYRFSAVSDPDAYANELQSLCEAHGIRGSVILAHEGINGMLAGTEEAVAAFCERLDAMPEFTGTQIKRSYTEVIPFKRLQVKVKPEIVTLRAGEVPIEKTAPHLAPEDFRAALDEPNTVVIDTRNDFEFRVGTFRGAINPGTTAFHEFVDYLETHRGELENSKILMFCTGGIRCEKATAWMIDHGFEDVYQLDGGVLNYFERIPDADKDWSGELFVFDERITVKTDLTPSTADRCVTCGAPVLASGEALCGCGNSSVSSGRSGEDRI
ncbi:MAG: rhodanese-like domain-containing protein [bacterium]